MSELIEKIINEDIIQEIEDGGKIVIETTKTKIIVEKS